MDFDKAFKIIIGHEGGYVNDPRDPGGETKYGVSKRAYPNTDIANLSLDDAKAIYLKDYWNACRCEELPDKIKLMVFDTAVNQGVRVAVKLLQQSVRSDVDGIIGHNTVKAANRKNGDDLLADYTSYRAVRYAGTRNFDVYGRGWMKRLFSVAKDSAES